MARDFQKSRVRSFSKSISDSGGRKVYTSLDFAIKDLTSMYLHLVDLLAINNKMIQVVPMLIQPHPNRTHTSIYSPSRHAIVCAVGSLHKRKLIHELSHALNKQIKNGKRRTIGASHGINYMTIYIFALGLFMFDGDFDHVEQIAQEHGCKYDSAKLNQLKQQQLERE